MRRLAVLVAVPVLLATPSALAWTVSSTAAQSVASATLDAPGGIDCTSVTGISTPITFVWTQPVALAGKPTGPLTYTVQRRANAGAWSTVASGLTATTFSEDPSGLLALGTVWDYRVQAVYGAWTSPWSANVTGVYLSVLLVTVLSTCTP